MTVESLDESDYGSDFSAGEAEIINKLLRSESTTTATTTETFEDNPIVNEIEYHDPPSSLRIPRVLGQDRRVADIEDAVTASRSKSTVAAVDTLYPDCKQYLMCAMSEAD